MSTAPNFNAYTVSTSQVYFVNSPNGTADPGGTGDTYVGGYPDPNSPTGWISTDGSTPLETFSFTTQSDGSVNVYVTDANVTNELYGTVTPTGDQNSSFIAFTGTGGSFAPGCGQRGVPLADRH